MLPKIHCRNFQKKYMKSTTVTDQEIVTYLRQSSKITDIVDLARKNSVVLRLCQSVGIDVSDEELQAAANAFRRERNLLGASEMLEWLDRQLIPAGDWAEGIRIALLKKKLKQFLFGQWLASDYASNPLRYRQVALSQILTHDFTIAVNLVQRLAENKVSFCALALEYSKGQQVREKGGFCGVRTLSSLLPEIFKAISDKQEGEIIGPIQTASGYHILRIEKWFPLELNDSVKEEFLELLFQRWLEYAEFDVPYIPTNYEVIESILELAEVTRDDVLYDLGSGDGRIVVAAAQKYGVRGVGVEMNPQRTAYSRRYCHNLGVTNVQFLQQDMFETDISAATVVTLYLQPDINLKLRSKLLRELKPGTRIVSNQFDMGDWKPDRAVQVSTPFRDHTLYYWVVPERVPDHLLHC